MSRKLYKNCVGWPENQIEALQYLIEHGVVIAREEFLAEVSPGQMQRIEKELGYDKNLKMSEDFHVRYFREPFTKIPFFVHSAIEHVFAAPAEIDLLTPYARMLENTEAIVLDCPARYLGQEAQDPDEFPDLLDEVINEVFGHFGPVIHIEDETRSQIGEHDRRLIDRIVSLADENYRALRIWIGDSEAPEGYTAVARDGVEAFISTQMPGAVIRQIPEPKPNICPEP